MFGSVNRFRGILMGWRIQIDFLFFAVKDRSYNSQWCHCLSGFAVGAGHACDPYFVESVPNAVHLGILMGF
ncbi:hypothetical protein DESC_580122 [Desulfosarcina cetonica]|nr:hypothetical protein DESC_580122 [Desulfosarcina cetonica]